uniref:Uncharacterized protein n=1 Tax=Anguilla anguilla TaxID=7936 RepID=A0A0E9T7D8_ANGAN
MFYNEQTRIPDLTSILF